MHLPHRRPFASAITLAVVMTTGLAFAGMNERALERDAKIAEQLRAKDASAASDFQAASYATRDHDLQRAAQLYARVLEAEPNFAPAMARRAILLARLGGHTPAIDQARKAVSIDKNDEDQTALAIALTTTPKGMHVTVPEADEAIAIMQPIATAHQDDIDTQLFYCHVAFNAGRSADLQTCSQRALALAPKEPEPYMFASFAALTRKDKVAANTYAQEAITYGADKHVFDGIDDIKLPSSPKQSRWTVPALWGAGVGIVAAIVLFGLRRSVAKSAKKSKKKKDADAT